MTTRGTMALSVLAILAMAAPAWADGDAAAGKTDFAVCSVCHNITSDAPKVGPSLMGVVGRKAGTQPKFAARYSPAMKKAGEDGLVWTEANLAEYIKSPKTKVPDNRMAFPGIQDPKKIADVIAYLKENSEH